MNVWLTVRDFACRSGRPMSTVYAMAKRGDIMACKMGRCIRIPATELDRFTNKGE